VHEHSSPGLSRRLGGPHINDVNALYGVDGRCLGRAGGRSRPRRAACDTPALCCALFAAATVYMTVVWEKDLNSPRFMLSGFVSYMNNTLCESSILIFSFYWAPWMDTIAREASQHLPYEVIFSSMILASMLGNYLFQMFARGSGAVSTPEAALQGLLVVSSGAYLLGAVFQRAGFALLCAVVVQLCVGGYWPCVGYYRGHLLMHEQCNTVIVLSRYANCVIMCCCALCSASLSALPYCLTLNPFLYTSHLPCRLGTLVITVTVLNTVHHSPLLAVCAALTGAAAYLQATYVSPAPMLYCTCTVSCIVASYPEEWLVSCVPCVVTVDGRQAESGGGG
jgi:hypothetical protein